MNESLVCTKVSRRDTAFRFYGTWAWVDRLAGVGERLESTECAACGEPVSYAGTGRRPRYCSASCRRTGWALHQAATRLGAGDDPRPSVVRETVTSERVRTVKVAGRAPTGAGAWARQIPQLTRQLHDAESTTARETGKHHGVAAALLSALTALYESNPDGLDWDGLAANHPDIARVLAGGHSPAREHRSAPSASAAGLSRQQRRARDRARRKGQ